MPNPTQTARRLGADPLRALLASCEVRILRDGKVVAIGAPAPDNLMSAPRLIGVSRWRDADAFTGPDMLRYAKAGIVWVCNTMTAASDVLSCLRLAGAPA
jgi:hypothetical protein